VKMGGCVEASSIMGPALAALPDVYSSHTTFHEAPNKWKGTTLTKP